MMNDYTFGNFLYSLRKNAGISQSQLADQLCVTNKAVSKWETGKSKPTTNTLRKIAALFGLLSFYVVAAEITAVSAALAAVTITAAAIVFGLSSYFYAAAVTVTPSANLQLIIYNLLILSLRRLHFRRSIFIYFFN